MDGAGGMSLAGVTADVAQASLRGRDPVADVNTSNKDRMFGEVLSRFGSKGTPEQQARTAAEEFVASALVKPVLAELRASNHAESPFAPGPYEKQFGPMIDNEIAARMVRSRGWGIVDAVERELSGARLKKGVSA